MGPRSQCICRCAGSTERLGSQQRHSCSDNEHWKFPRARYPKVSACEGRAAKLAGTRRPLYIVGDVIYGGTDQTRCGLRIVARMISFSKPPAMDELRARLRAADRITSMQADLLQLATTDPLTGLQNRRAFVERLEKQYKGARNKVRTSVVIARTTGRRFKAINDSFGHEIGDRVLKAVSDELNMLNLPVGRLGGEEFAVLLNGSLEDAIDIAEYLRKSIGNLAVGVGSEVVKVTCSFGVAEWEPGDTVDLILRRADICPFMKPEAETGRDRVSAADEFQISEAHQQWRGIARQLARQSE